MQIYKCKDTKELVVGYDAYLHTLHWKNKRRHIYKIRNKTCEKCGKKINNGETYNVHHKNYKRVGNEKDTDLMLLCPKCHEKIHKVQDQAKKMFNFFKRLFFWENDKQKTGNRKPIKKRQNIKNGAKSTAKNKKKSRKNNRT